MSVATGRLTGGWEKEKYLENSLLFSFKRRSSFQAWKNS
jgi:hypothetical protein